MPTAGSRSGRINFQITDCLPNTHSRTTPSIKGNTLYLGTQEGAWLLAIDANKGTLLWKTQLETADPFAIITTSPTVQGNTVYTGVASSQEASAAFIPGFVCCSARGSVVAVSANKGAIQWKTYTVPTGYSGGGVWGSSPVVDTARGTVFIGTGNNYSKPTDPAYLACIAGGGIESNCLAPNDYVDSILALDMNTGAVKWSKRLVTWAQYGVTDGSDDWNVACFVPPFTNCPSAPAGPITISDQVRTKSHTNPHTVAQRRSSEQDKRAVFTMLLILIRERSFGTPRLVPDRLSAAWNGVPLQTANAFTWQSRTFTVSLIRRVAQVLGLRWILQRELSCGK